MGGEAKAAVLQVAEDPASSSAEAFRMLRMSILFEAMADSAPNTDPFAEGGGWAAPVREPYRVPEPGSRQVVLVVSPGTEDTRAVVAANLGAAFGEAGQRVIVISTADIDSGHRGARALGASATRRRGRPAGGAAAVPGTERGPALPAPVRGQQRAVGHGCPGHHAGGTGDR